MSRPVGTPLVSICVPTHHGRRAALGELIAGVIAQAQEIPGLVEICVSDNASVDGTDEMLTELSRRSPYLVKYDRNSEDIGLSRNLLKTVELARGRYCWLLGSDDLLAAGALRRACRLLHELEGATGYVVGATHVDAEDPRLRSRALPSAFHPPHDQARLIEGLDRIYDECANAWCALSWSIVDREAWLRAAERQAGLLNAHPVFPQILILAAMAVERPCWGWLPEPLVHQRNATTFLFERGETSMAARWTHIISSVASAWAAVLGKRGGLRWRRRMRRLHEVWGTAADVRATKLYQDPSLVSQIRLALACLGAFWPSHSYWREVLPATLLPARVVRARYGVGTWALLRRGGRRAAQLRIAGELPQRMVAGTVKQARLEVYNEGREAILPDGARAVTIGQRWYTQTGHALSREELGLNELAAYPQQLARAVRPGHAVQTELALYAPREPGIYGLRVVAHQHGHGWLDERAGAGLPTAEIQVVPVAMD
jgi:Glycosyl transferase family 2